MDFRPIIFLLTVLPLLLTAGILAARAWQGQRKVIAARKWPRTTGRVVFSAVEETMLRQRISTSTSRYRWVKRFVPQIVYEFQVGGKIIKGTRVYFGEVLFSSDTTSSQRVVERYPVGSPVTVYYAPDHPEDAVLELRLGWGTRLLWGVTFGLLGVTGWLAWIIFSSP
ncbi:MAG TPA: DUF3592 domain-containing protein [Anaerolineales bacterium]|nr:DUF3592 domain-containing protein [Anaerolineales bacterium]